MNHSSLPYRPCVGIMLLNAQNKVFVAQRLDSRTEAWQMPQGGIDKDEDPLQAAKRELLEEIGTNNMSIVVEGRDWLSYDLPDDLIGKVWKGKYRGQRQKWFLARFEGVDADINLETEHPEFSKWQWMEPSALPDVIVPFKKQLYQDVLSEFLPHIGV